MTNLKKYKCNKIVEGAEIIYIDYNAGMSKDKSTKYSNIVTIDGTITVDNKYIEKHEPKVGGYYVRYKDGYQSFSPKEAFEEGYTEIKT